MLAISVVSALQLQMETASAEDRPAKEVFGHMALPSATGSQPIGSYAKGCQSGAIAMPTDGPGWQAMRLSATGAGANHSLFLSSSNFRRTHRRSAGRDCCSATFPSRVAARC